VKTATFILTTSLLVSTATSACADAISNNISSQLNQTALDAFSQDVGTIMAAGSFHEGKALGFPLGIDIGGHMTMIELQDDDAILRDDDSRATAGWLQAEIGLPYNLNVIARGGQFEDANIYGGGLRYGILNPAIPLAPSLSITGLYTIMDHSYVDADTVSGNLVLSVEVPFIHPYIGLGWDRTHLQPTGRAFDAAPAGTPSGQESKESGYRSEVGINLSIIPFTYLNFAVGIANAKTLYHAGLGARF
jgi:hypothetical protein